MLGLTACGGGGGGSDSGSGTADAAAASANPASTVAPLFANDGEPSAAARLVPPRDAAAHTRAGLYAVDIAMVAHELATHPSTLAYFVKASDPRAGARLADRLADTGLEHVFLLVDSNAADAPGVPIPQRR